MVLLPSSSPHNGSRRKSLFARSGWEIPTDEMKSSMKHKMDYECDLFVQKFNVEIRSRSLYPYNCVGMVFAFRRAFIDPDHLERILVEDGYTQISDIEIKRGDIVLYSAGNSITHVGLIYHFHYVHHSSTVPIVTVLSKWGPGPECLHEIRSVPETYGIPARYYTERVK